MNTFLPYESYVASAAALDYKRLGKQRIECITLINILSKNITMGSWVNHPATLMWKGYVPQLIVYYNCILAEWIKRGYNSKLDFIFPSDPNSPKPPWLGKEEFHSSHRQTLLFKDFKHYSQFGWTETPQYKYWWPTKEMKELEK